MNSHAATAAQLGKILKARRNELGLTQKEAADKRGLLPKTVSLLENDPQRCSVETLYKYLSALDLKIQLQSKSYDSDSLVSEW